MWWFTVSSLTDRLHSNSELRGNFRISGHRHYSKMLYLLPLSTSWHGQIMTWKTNNKHYVGMLNMNILFDMLKRNIIHTALHFHNECIISKQLFMKVTAGDTLLHQTTLLTMEAEDGGRSNHLFQCCHLNDYKWKSVMKVNDYIFSR